MSLYDFFLGPPIRPLRSPLTYPRWYTFVGGPRHGDKMKLNGTLGDTHTLGKKEPALGGLRGETIAAPTGAVSLWQRGVWPVHMLHVVARHIHRCRGVVLHGRDVGC